MKACHTCLSLIPDNIKAFYVKNVYMNPSNPLPDAISIKEKLLECVPELLLDSTPMAVLCEPCVKVLMIAYGFRQKCLETQQQIYGYLQQMPNSTQIDILEIAKHYNRLQIIAQGGNPFEDLHNAADSVPLVQEEHEELKPVSSCHNTSAPKRKKQLPEPSASKSSKSIHQSPKTPPPPQILDGNLIDLLYDDISISNSKTSLSSQPPKEATTNITCTTNNDAGSKGTSRRKEQLFHCQMCPMVFSEPSDLKDHFEVTHKHPLIKCVDCPFTTRMPFIMRKHNRTHKKKKKWQFGCDKCKYVGRKEQALIDHLKGKHGIRHPSANSKQTGDKKISGGLVQVPLLASGLAQVPPLASGLTQVPPLGSGCVQLPPLASGCVQLPPRRPGAPVVFAAPHYYAAPAKSLAATEKKK